LYSFVEFNVLEEVDVLFAVVAQDWDLSFDLDCAVVIAEEDCVVMEKDEAVLPEF
jgi:hypothetical protein